MELKYNTTIKPWGQETIINRGEGYVCKFLVLNAGAQTSTQYHEEKDESMTCIKGKGIIEFFDEDLNVTDTFFCMPQSKSYVHIPPNTIHRISAFEPLTLIEASTDHLDDVVRLADKYGR